MNNQHSTINLVSIPNSQFPWTCHFWKINAVPSLRSLSCTLAPSSTENFECNFHESADPRWYLGPRAASWMHDIFCMICSCLQSVWVWCDFHFFHVRCSGHSWHPTLAPESPHRPLVVLLLHISGKGSPAKRLRFLKVDLGRSQEVLGKMFGRIRLCLCGYEVLETSFDSNLHCLTSATKNVKEISRVETSRFHFIRRPDLYRVLFRPSAVVTGIGEVFLCSTETRDSKGWVWASRCATASWMWKSTHFLITWSRALGEAWYIYAYNITYVYV